jgi:hypothetical protein
LNSWFLPAMALIVGQGVGFAQTSQTRPSTLVPLMLSGMTLALKASSESKPRLLSMACLVTGARADVTGDEFVGGAQGSMR